MNLPKFMSGTAIQSNGQSPIHPWVGLGLGLGLGLGHGHDS